MNRSDLWQKGLSAARDLAARLDRSGLSVSFAESCTGGLVGALLTSIPGISQHLTEGHVTYADGAKTRILGVPEGMIREHGAVSEPCARSMAEGAARIAGSDVSLAVTGIAGPGGGTPDKPVGTVFIAVSCQGRIETRRLQLGNPGREEVRLRSALAVLELAREFLDAAFSS
jgi:PncC family amidohydrolase